MAFQFKIQLKDITDPPVWRRLLIPEQFSFLRFHEVIQTAFGWENCHLFQFSSKGYSSSLIITVPNAEWDDEPPLDSKKTKLMEIFTTPKQKFTYIYDFGDDWIHTITLEKITKDKILRANCVAGKGACPPEDCGGPWGYTNLKNILNDPKNPEHKSMKEWLGLTGTKAWDAEAFDLEKTIRLVLKV
jgi:Plasmid pRiA4b ORF-3-like protein